MNGTPRIRQAQSRFLESLRIQQTAGRPVGRRDAKRDRVTMKPRPTACRLSLAVLVYIGSSFLFSSPVKAQFARVYTVNTTTDTVMAGACDNDAAGCSLRGALEAASSISDSVITFSIPEVC